MIFQNGARAFTYNATEPDQLRGPEHDLAWSDELAKWKLARDTWDQLQFGLRRGTSPRQIITTTPRPIRLLKDIVAGREGEAVSTVGHTLDNKANLSKRFLKKIMKKYSGTRLGQQELAGRILGDAPNALFTQANIEENRVRLRPEKIGRVVVSVDPSASEDEDADADENGIVVAAISEDGNHGYVLEDASIRGSPRTWASKAVSLYRQYQADAIIAEINNGGAMVSHTIYSVDNNVPVITVTATRGKHIRAEPVSSLYEQGRISHIGEFLELEEQMTSMTTTGYLGDDSPDRCDALVWAFTELFGEITDAVPLELPEWRPRLVV